MKQKKILKALTLKKETIANLDGIELSNARGGTDLSALPGVLCLLSCGQPGGSVCPEETDGCTSADPIYECEPCEG
jgi:hypothetical protein